jgi:O-antigen/teichoic acid export membrane protein
MLINAAALVGTTVVTSVLGFAYWWLAARRFPPEAVGVASASISAMVLLGGFCVLGFGTLLITELPRQPGRAASLISSSLVVVGVVGEVVGFAFAIVAPFTSAGFKELGASLVNMTLFASGVSLTAMAVVLDQALIGLLHGKLQFGRNTFFAIAKLVALFGLSFLSSGKAGILIYATWAMGIVISLAALTAHLLHKGGWPGRNYLPRWSVMRKLGGAALQHHILNMTLQAPVLMLPLLVTALLSATMNAWFYVSWMLVSFVFLIPNTLTIVLHAMNSAQQSTLTHKARVTLAVGLATSLLANCVLQVAAKQVLSLFGPSYAQEAAGVLRILLLAAFPLNIKYHYIAICRIQDRIKRAMLGMLPGGLLGLGAAALGARLGGLTGLSVGWVAAVYIESLFMSRTVARAVRGSRADIDAIYNGPDWFMYSTQIPATGPDNVGGDAIWLMDTISMPIVRLTAIKKANRESERRWRERGFQSKWSSDQDDHVDHLYPVRSTIPARQDTDGSGSRPGNTERKS